MHQDPTFAYFSGILSTLALNEVSPLQTVILSIIYHKRTASSTAVLETLNNVIPTKTQGFCKVFRTQSSVSHALTSLQANGYIQHIAGLALYGCTTKGYAYITNFLKSAYEIDTNLSHLQRTLQKMQPMHVDSQQKPC